MKRLTAEQAIKMALAHLADEVDAELVTIGTVPKEHLGLLDNLREAKEDLDDLHDQMDEKLEAYKAKLEREHRRKCRQMKKQIDELHCLAFEAAGLDANDYKDRPIHIDGNTGKLQVEMMVVDKTEGPVN